MEFAEELKTVKIFMVEADITLRRSMEHYFRWKTLSFVATGSSEEALELFRKGDYDIVICDNGVHGMNKLAFLKALEQISPNTLRMLFITYADIQVITEAAKIGITDFIQKPFNMETFKKSIAMLIKKRDAKSSEIMVDGKSFSKIE